jgi:uncharacterized protein YpmB
MARARRRGLMSRRGWTLWIVAFVVLLLVLLLAEYRSLQQPVWAAELQAEKLAQQSAGLKETSSAEKYVWDQPVWIVRGKNAEGQDMIAWLPQKGDPLLLEASACRTAQDIRSIFKQRQPDAVIQHVRAGMLGGQPAWEVFYTRKLGQTRYYYDFYQFQSGAYITTYSLTSKKAS